jgi:predicted cupin superfamily sugar epimerase
MSFGDPAANAGLGGRAADLARWLGLRPHPEGGWYREVFRSGRSVDALDGRPLRQAMTSIDFLLAAGQRSAWHRVRSDEAWHLLEGGPLRLWLAPPDLTMFSLVQLSKVTEVGGEGSCRPRHVVPADWWQAAEPLGEYAYVGATVGPGFEFDDFAFGRDDVTLCDALQRQAPQLQRLL